MWGVVLSKLFLLSIEPAMRHRHPILSSWQTFLISHDTERLSNLAKVTQLIHKRSQLLSLGSLNSVLGLSHYAIQSRMPSGP